MASKGQKRERKRLELEETSNWFEKCKITKYAFDIHFSGLSQGVDCIFSLTFFFFLPIKASIIKTIVKTNNNTQVYY